MSPYSSTTIAMCWFVFRNSREERGDVLGLRDDVRAAAGSPPDRRSAMPRSFIAFSRSRRWSTPMMCSGVSAVDRVARVRRVERPPAGTPPAACPTRDDTTSGRGPHHVGGLLVGEVEDLVEHLLLLLFELALDGRALEQHLQLGLRVDGARRRPAAPARAARSVDVARSLQEPDQRLEDQEEPAHGERDEAARSARSSRARSPSGRARRRRRGRTSAGGATRIDGDARSPSPGRTARRAPARREHRLPAR